MVVSYDLSFSTIHLSTVLAVTSRLLGEREISSRPKLLDLDGPLVLDSVEHADNIDQELELSLALCSDILSASIAQCSVTWFSCPVTGRQWEHCSMIIESVNSISRDGPEVTYM